MQGVVGLYITKSNKQIRRRMTGQNEADKNKNEVDSRDLLMALDGYRKLCVSLDQEDIVG